MKKMASVFKSWNLVNTKNLLSKVCQFYLIDHLTVEKVVSFVMFLFELKIANTYTV